MCFENIYILLLYFLALTKVKSGRIKRGRNGHDVILVLDISKRMEGSKFESMINTALQYVEGICF